MNVGIIGAGAIATYLLEEQEQYEYKITSIFVRHRQKYKHLEKKFGVTLYTDFQMFLQSRIDIVVEAAGVAAAKQLITQSITYKDTIIISIGALTDMELLEQIILLAKRHQHNLYLPSGAIGGLDLVQNVATVKTIDNITIETRKPANTLVSDELTGEQVVFEGSSAEAIKHFPKNINVGVILGLAGIGLNETRVRIVADSSINKNIHTITLSGAFGEATFKIQNEPLPTNPKTSYLAAMSIIGILERINNPIKIG